MHRSERGLSALKRDPSTGNSGTSVKKPFRASLSFALAFLLVSGFCFLILGSSPAAALDWTIETVDSTGDVGQYTSLALDYDDLPRISYMDWTNYHLKYASKTEGVWIVETVDTTHGTGEYTSLELDASSGPVISYYDVNQGNLSIATKTGSVWTSATADSGNVGRYTSLAIDPSGNLQIAYQDLLNMKLKYAGNDSGFWTSETVDSGNVGAYSSLALDPSGNPGISYYDAAHSLLKYAHKSGGLWSAVVVDNSGNPGYYTSVAFDDEGNPAISYYDMTGKDLKFASRTGGVWKKEIVDSAGNVGMYTSLSLDASGNPHISYYDSTSGHLKYAVKSGLVWTNETVDNSTNVGLYTSLALDDQGNPRISYRDSRNGDLRYATGIPPLALNFTAIPLNGTAPLVVQFYDTSTGGSKSWWNWSFGDGSWFNTSVVAERNPAHAYQSQGAYTVNLIVRNSDVFAEMSKPGYITVAAPPVTIEPTVPPTPLPTSENPTPSMTPTSSPSPTPDLTTSPSPSPTPDPSPSLTPSPSPSPTLNPTPSPTPFASGSDVQSFESGDDPPDLPPVRTESGPLACVTVNVGGSSAIRSVSVIGRDLSDLIISSRQVSTPVSLPPDVTAFQYIELVPLHYASITAAVIDFDVPESFISDNHASPGGVWLWILRNQSWIRLTTISLDDKDGMKRYRAVSPEFSIFAIALGNETFTLRHEGEFPKSNADHGISEDSGKAGVPYSRQSVLQSTTPEENSGNLPVPLIITFTGLCGLGTSAVIISRWRNQR